MNRYEVRNCSAWSGPLANVMVARETGKLAPKDCKGLSARLAAMQRLRPNY
jgi:hypothetical protein